MGCAGSSKVADEEKETFKKGGDKDLSEGPRKNRGCTDILCLILFIVHWLGFLVVAFIGVRDGHPMKLVRPRDFKGDYCSLDHEKHEYGTMTMNISQTVDPIARELVCSAAAESELQGLVNLGRMTSAEFQQYACACCTSSCDSCSSSGLTTHLNVESMRSSVSSQMAGLTGGMSATSLFSSSGPNGDLFANAWREATKYFHPVCSKKCNPTRDTSNRMTREYVYEASADLPWALAWKLLKDEQSVSSTIRNSINEDFKFMALDRDMCPYDSGRYCVPFPGLAFSNSLQGHCVPKLDDGAASAVGGAAAEAYEDLAESDIAKDVQESLGTAVGSVVYSLDVMVIVCIWSLVIGLIFLVLLRFVVGAVVWGSLVLVFGFLLACGFGAHFRSRQCLTDSLQETGFLQTDCPDGYMHESQQTRDLLQYAAYVFWALSLIWLLLVACLFKRIRLAVAVNQVAAMFVYSNPMTLFVPLVQIFIGVAYVVLWAVCSAFVLSQVPSNHVPSDAYATYSTAHGTDDDPGKCTDMSPPGFVWKDENCAFDATPKCFKCGLPRYVYNRKYDFMVFSWFWNIAFIIALGQFIIAAAVGVWFFTPAKDKMHAPVLRTAWRLCWRYHLGTMAFGSLILAIVQFIRYLMKKVQDKAKQSKNKVLERIMACLGCCVWCFEKCIKFLNKNAYIQCALMGTNFCTSARAAFFLILRNALRFGTVAMLGGVIHTLGVAFIVVATGCLGYYFLQSIHPKLSPIMPVCIYVVIGYFVAKLFMNVFGLAVDTALQCFIAAEEMGNAGEFCPGPMMGLLNCQRPEDDGTAVKEQADAIKAWTPEEEAAKEAPELPPGPDLSS